MTIASSEVLHSSQSARKDELLKKIGGKKFLLKAVDTFYGRLLRDKRLQPFFHGSNIRLLKWHQFNFLALAFSSVPEDLDLDSLVLNRHERLFQMGLNEKHFDLMLDHLEATFLDLSIDDAIAKQAVEVLKPMRTLFQRGAQLALKPRCELLAKTAKVSAVAALGAIVYLQMRRRR